MATGNFYYENRCVVVTNEDFDFGNVPAHSEFDKSSNRSYPSYFLDDADFDFWDVVITCGYYTAACIDYVKKYDYYGNDIVTSRMKYSWNYESVNDLIRDFVREFGVTEYRAKKIIGKLSDCVDLEKFCERAFERMNDYLSELEEKKVNEFINKIKENYGYEEYETSVRFSNGETWYSKIS